MSEISYRRTLVSGIFYNALARYSGLLVSILTTSVLARLLTPEDFGIIAIATIFITFFSTLSDLGIGPAIIQNKELTDEDYKNLFSFTIYLGIFLSLFFLILAKPIGVYYKSDVLVSIIQILSISVFFTSINTVPSSLLLASCRFKIVGIRTFVIQLILAPISIIAAFKGMGVYSLVLSPLLSSIIIFFVNYRYYPIQFRFKFEQQSIRKVSHFSIYQFSFNFVNFFTRNLDKLLIGRILGMIPLGYFEKSYRLMMLPLQNLTHIITPSFHPIFSQFQDDLPLQRARYFNILKYLGYIAFPLGVYLFYTAKEWILIFFGDQWLPAVASFKILCFSIPTQIIGSTQGSIFQATNKTKIMFYTGMSNSIVYMIILILGIHIGKSIEAAALMFVLACYVNCWIYNVICKKVLLCKPRDFYSLFKAPFVLTIILFVCIGAIDYLFLIRLDLHIIAQLFIKTILITVISYFYYVIFCQFSIKKFLSTCFSKN